MGGVCLFLVISCLGILLVDDSGQQRSAQRPESPNVDYSIVDSDIRPGIKRGLDVRIDKKLSEDELRRLAFEIRDSDPNTYKRTFICYYLPDMKVGAGAWATTHFNPELEVRILGLTVQEEHSFTAKVDDPSREFIGKWLDEQLYQGNRAVIFKEDGRVLLENTFGDGGTVRTELLETASQRGRRFENAGGSKAGDYYLITSSGTLEVWDNEGLISQARAIWTPPTHARTSDREPSETSDDERTSPPEVLQPQESAPMELGNGRVADAEPPKSNEDERISPPEDTQPQKPAPQKLVNGRIWTDNTGKFSIEAEFKSYANGIVTLMKADGSTIKLPKAKLSDEDQEWIKQRGRR